MQAKPSKAPPVYTSALTPDGCAIYRNGVAFNTPAGKPFIVPTQKLGESILAEWRAQGEKIIPDAMPMTQLASTAIDIVGKDSKAIADQIIAYAASELMCYRAELPPELPVLQHQVWQPLLDWCAQAFRAPLNTGIGIIPVKQPEDSLQSLCKVIGTYDPFRLTGLRQAVDLSGSFVIGLALTEGHVTSAEAFEAAELDTLFQIKKWGEDPVTLARHAGVRRDLDICAQWFDRLKP